MNKTTELSKQNKSVSLTSPKEIVSFANDLKQLITDNTLYTNIKGKNYVNVEGWQIALAFTGIYPIVEQTENLCNDKEIKYRAAVTLWQPVQGQDEPIKVGQAFATCSNLEYGKSKFDEYAIESMAQTRALGKAGRMKLGWLLKISGYETTPAEEMEPIAVNISDVETVEPKPQPEKPKAEVKLDSKEKSERDKELNKMQMYMPLLQQAGMTIEQIKQIAIDALGEEKSSKDMSLDELMLINETYGLIIDGTKGKI